MMHFLTSFSAPFGAEKDAAWFGTETTSCLELRKLLDTELAGAQAALGPTPWALPKMMGKLELYY